jgi:GAF domain-containing protein
VRRFIPGGGVVNPATSSTPLREAERRAALEAYDIVDAPVEEAWDDLVRMAARICGRPMAALSVMDAAGQGFSAEVGMEREPDPPTDAACAVTLHGSDPLVVPDLSRDPRFRDNAQVRSEGGVRFYAGFPVVTPDGDTMGTLCVMDREPGALTPSQLAAMESLSRVAARELELRRTSRELADALRRAAVLEEVVPLCSTCRRVREDDEYREALGMYIARNTGSLMSHGICPECAEREFSDIDEDG